MIIIGASFIAIMDPTGTALRGRCEVYVISVTKTFNRPRSAKDD